MAIYGEKGNTQAARELIEWYSVVNYGDFIRCHGVPADLAKPLMDALPEANLHDHQNYAPTLETLLNAPNLVSFMAYIVTEERDDERVTVEGVTLAVSPEDWERAEDIFYNGDMADLDRGNDPAFQGFGLPDELACQGEDDNGNVLMFMWWD